MDENDSSVTVFFNSSQPAVCFAAYMRKLRISNIYIFIFLMYCNGHIIYSLLYFIHISEWIFSLSNYYMVVTCTVTWQ